VSDADLKADILTEISKRLSGYVYLSSEFYMKEDFDHEEPTLIYHVFSQGHKPRFTVRVDVTVEDEDGNVV